MEKLFQQFLYQTGPVLCLDIGSGTQEAVLARPGFDVENWPCFVLPSPAMSISQRLRELALLKKDVWLCGHIMGAGFLPAVAGLLQAGRRVYATSQIMQALAASGCMAEACGLETSDSRPAGAVPVHLADYSAQGWETLLRCAGLPMPHLVLACARDDGSGQDDGASCARMDAFAALLGSHADPVSWLSGNAPHDMARLQALQEATGGPVTDSAIAAIIGAMADKDVRARSLRQGVTFVNVGNDHIVAALLYRGQVHGIYEHHTACRTREELLADLGEFRRCFLPVEAVQASGGHGTAYAPLCEEAGGYEPTFVSGSKRALLAGYGQELAPFGAMKLAGPLGLLYGYSVRQTGC